LRGSGRHRHQRDAALAGLQETRGCGRRGVRARAGVREAALTYLVDSSEQSRGPEIERVIVREREHVEAHGFQTVENRGRSGNGVLRQWRGVQSRRLNGDLQVRERDIGVPQGFPRMGERLGGGLADIVLDQCLADEGNRDARLDLA
jgi:hypothetical protein